MADSDMDLTGDRPPAGITGAKAALWWLAKGEFQTGDAWEKAHEICQSAEGEPAHDAAHGLAHWIEGDHWNSDYWYRRANLARTSEIASEEWRHLVGWMSGT